MYLYYTQVIIYSTFSIIELREKSKILYYRSLILGQIELNLIIVKVEIFVFSVQFKSTKSLIALLASFSMRIDMLLLQGISSLFGIGWMQLSLSRVSNLRVLVSHGRFDIRNLRDECYCQRRKGYEVGWAKSSPLYMLVLNRARTCRVP